jgi:hypothetical protein
MHPSIDDDNIQFAMVLQNPDVLAGVPVDKDTIGVIARPDLAQLVAAHEQRRHAGRGGDDGLVGREVEEGDEVL